MWHDRTVGVLMGGLSAEREVSLGSGAACARALRSKGYRVVEIDAGRNLAQRLTAEKIDVVFNILHGKWGEDGCVQGLLEILRIPYTGPGVMAAAAAMDKVVAKIILREAGLPLTKHHVIQKEDDPSMAPPLPLPLVVKPVTEGSSVGVSIVTGADQYPGALREAFRNDSRALVEPYVRGREICVAVLDGRALGLVEVQPKPVEGEEISFYDYKHKYTEGMTRYITDPPGLSEKVRLQAMELGRRADAALGAEGASRVDMILDDSGDFVILEINTLPGMTALSLVPMIAKDWAGMDFPDLVEGILNTARLKIGV